MTAEKCNILRVYELNTDLSTKTDAGSIEGVSWMLSSAKERHGIAQLTSDDLDTLWQCVVVTFVS